MERVHDLLTQHLGRLALVQALLVFDAALVLQSHASLGHDGCRCYAVTIDAERGMLPDVFLEADGLADGALQLGRGRRGELGAGSLQGGDVLVLWGREVCEEDVRAEEAVAV